MLREEAGTDRILDADSALVLCGSFARYEIELDKSAPFVASAVAFAGTPPLEFLAAFVDAVVSDAEKRKTISRRLFGTYNAWLALLGDDVKRKRLESLGHEQAATGEVFQEVRRMSSEFSKGLQLLFFNRDSDPDPIAQLSLEYVAF